MRPLVQAVLCTLVLALPLAASDLSIYGAPVVGAVGVPFNVKIGVWNLTNTTSSNVTVTVPLPAGLTWINGPGCSGSSTVVCSLGDVPLGGPKYAMITMVGADLSSSTTLTATASSATPDPDSSNNSVPIAVTIVLPRSDLSVTVTPYTPTTAMTPGSELSADIRIINNGAAPTSVSLFVNVPDGSVPDRTCTNISGNDYQCLPPVLLLPGQEAECGWFTSVPLANGSYSLLFTVKSSLDDNIATNSVAVPFSVGTPSGNYADLGVTITAPPTITAGQTATWTIATTNRGPATAFNPIVRITPPAGWLYYGATRDRFGCTMQSGAFVCSGANLLPGATQHTMLTMMLPAETGITVPVIATAFSDTRDFYTDDNVAASVTTMLAPDLAVTATPVSQFALPGSTVPLTITVTNHGSFFASHAVLTSAISGMTVVSATTLKGTCTTSPLACDFGPLAVDQTVPVSLVLTAPAKGPGTLTVTVSSHEGDLAHADNQTSVVVEAATHHRAARH